METEQRKTAVSVGLLAHVGVSRREPHLKRFIPGPKTGDFSCPVKTKLFQGIKILPYVVVRCGGIPQHMVVDNQDLALQPFSASQTR